MKNVIIVRHGYYCGEDLHEIGRLQIKVLGEAIKTTLNGDSIQMLSSTAPRATQSAEILAEIFGVGFEQHEFLWSGPDSPNGCSTDLEKVLQLISSSSADVVILVTHLEYSERFPAYFGKNVLDVRSFPRNETNKGEAWVIDCVQKTCSRLTTEHSK